MADVNRGNRPLSPFVLGKHYKFQLNSATSILTRITGNALVVEAILIAWWFLAAAAGPDHFAVADFVITSWVGDIILLLSMVGLWYHALSGVRHLLWDNGYCLEVETSDKLSWAIFIGTAVLSIITIIFV